MIEPTPDHAEQDFAGTIDDVVPSRRSDRVPLVGLGGSAGAIDALGRFFDSMPARTGLAFVVVIHLSADHESSLAELIQRHTTMRVLQVQDTVEVEPDTVYVIPPRKALQAADGYLRLSDLAPGRGRHVAIDLFFRTLADCSGSQAAAVVLSGLDGDGSIGIKRIKERGGLTIAQDPEEAEHGGMPRSAIGTGMIDWVLPIEQVPSRLLAYFQLESNLRLPPEHAPSATPPADGSETALRHVLTFLRTRTGRDFSAYKRATIVRRIARRMQVNGVDNLPAYLDCLRLRPGETGSLLQDMLISVTNFFRDGDCFAALEANIPRLFEGKGHGDTVRVWVAACATGEEAYSVAMLLAEHARTLESPPMLQVFATDLDEEALRVAREGIYSPAIEADVSQERLRQHFVRDTRGWRVRREIREVVLFALHDLLKDSPFSRLDLVACRNVLIYLNREAQTRAFETFHFALAASGLLFLGASESIDDDSPLFAAVDKKGRLYQRRATARFGVPVPVPLATAALTLNPVRSALPNVPLASPAGSEMRLLGGASRRGPTWAEIHLRLLEHLAPPSVLVNRDHEVVHLSLSAGRFLQFSGGEPSSNLLKAVHPSLRMELRAALSQAQQTNAAAEVRDISVQLSGLPVTVTLRVMPVVESSVDLLLVIFDARAQQETAAEARDAARTEPDPVARHLDRELDRLKAHLRDTVEQYEASTEELKASNEELQAMNEELRSAGEELETGREELQSINEELTTVNQELKVKVDQLGQANSDLQNLMEATAIPTVFLDRNLHIMRFTPPAVGLFRLIGSDIGRPLGDLAGGLDYPELRADAQRVLDRLTPVEREVSHADGTFYLARLLPYRTVEDRISGVVLAFIDITAQRKAQEVQLWLSSVVTSSADAIISFAMDGTILSWNNGAQRLFGHQPSEAVGRPIKLLGVQELETLAPVLQQVAEGRHVEGVVSELACQDGAHIRVLLTMSPIADKDGKVIAGTAIARDITTEQAARQALQASEERLRLIVESAREYAIFALDVDRRVTSWNSGAERLLGYAEDEILGHSGDIIFTEEDRVAGAPESEARGAIEDGRAKDDRMHVRKDGTRFWAQGMVMSMRDAGGHIVGLVKILRDQTAERDSQQALETSQSELIQALAETQRARQQLEAADAAKDRFLAVLSHELRNPLASIASASELLLMPKLPDAALEKAAQVVQRQSRAMKVLLDELLDVSRLSLGRLTLTRRPVAMSQVIQTALETTRPLVQAAGHQLVVDLPAESVEIDGDPLRLAQVISNLVSNAAKYTPEGGRIDVRAEVFNDEVVVTVADNGIGMDPAEIDRMFDLFSQAAGAINRSNGGLGIGLALARNIVELHGGWIMASSAGPGQGSQLRVGLPLLRVAPAGLPLATPEPVPQPPKPASAAEGELVLVADDNGDAAWGLAKLLELSGYRAVLARSGAEALAMAEQHRPAVALLDIGMPDLSGHDVARRLREKAWGRDMILIAATGWGQEADIRHSMEAGFDAHLTKPLNVARIRSLIEELAAKRKGG